MTLDLRLQIGERKIHIFAFYFYIYKHSCKNRQSFKLIFVKVLLIWKYHFKLWKMNFNRSLNKCLDLLEFLSCICKDFFRINEKPEVGHVIHRMTRDHVT